MKKEPFLPTCHYLIKNSGNNFETLFLEERNYSYFLALFNKHVGQIATLKAFRFFRNKFELLIQIKDISQLPPKYQDSLHQPFSNFFNAYSQSINKAYGRSGSLFREHFKRERIDDRYVPTLKRNMEENPITIHNLPKYEVAQRLRRDAVAIRRKNPGKLKFLNCISKIAASLFLASLLYSFTPHPRKFHRNNPNDTIPKILNHYLPKLAQPQNQDSVFYPYEPYYDDSTGNFIAIGHLIDKQEIHAISTSKHDSLITFYAFENPEWKIIGKEKLVNFEEFVFEDIDGDAKNELIAQSGTNMNGNREYNVFHLSASGKILLAGNFFGRYQLIPGKKVGYVYEGSYYSDNIYTLYEWRNDNLIPVRSVTLYPEDPEGSNRRKIIFEQKRTPVNDAMQEVFNEVYNPKNKKHRYVIEHLFDDTFQFK